MKKLLALQLVTTSIYGMKDDETPEFIPLRKHTPPPAPMFRICKKIFVTEKLEKEVRSHSHRPLNERLDRKDFMNYVAQEWPYLANENDYEINFYANRHGSVFEVYTKDQEVRDEIENAIVKNLLELANPRSDL